MACILLAVAGLLAASGCATRSAVSPTSVSVSPTASTAPAATGASESPVSQSTSSPAKAQAARGPSAKSLAYAKKIGGRDHNGLNVYLIVGGSFGTEDEAQAALDKALPLFGHVRPYFIVQRSDSFAGMASGRWVVIEAHFKTPSKGTLQFAHRGFPGAHVERARIVVSAPVPVYEDLVGGD